jgi:hypothetical protein
MIRGGWKQVALLRLLTALTSVNLLLLAPQWLAHGGVGPHWIALEAALLAGLFALLPRRRWSAWLAGITALLLVLVSLLAFADVAARLSLARPLNLYLDLHLLSAVHHLLVGSLGQRGADLIIAAILFGALLLTGLLAWLLVSLRAQPRAWISRVTALALIAFSGLGIAGDQQHAYGQRLATPAVRVATDQTSHWLRMLGERERFAAELAARPREYAARPGLLHRLRDRDVLLAFIESYGESALFDPRYAPVIRPRLANLEARATAAGLHLASGRLLSPVQGGQSWLAHGTLLSGLWLDNQLRYDLLLASGRETLVDDFRHAGHATVALMPAITLVWPEGERLGYERVYARRDIDYAGPALNWVTMPDQFTWSFLEHRIRATEPGPLFVELALISSHAPWTPILPVLDWDGIGDGVVFSPWAGAGERPADLWRDPERVREHFALAVDYALNAMTGYAERHVDERTLLIVLGDHQPSPLITGENAGRAVPVHVLSADPALVRPFLDWGFVPGAVPDPARPAARMDAFRDWFIEAFSASDSGI